MALTKEQYEQAQRIIESINGSGRSKVVGKYLLEHPGRNPTYQISSDLGVKTQLICKAVYYLRGKGVGIKSEPRSPYPYYELTMDEKDNLPEKKKSARSASNCEGFRFVKKAHPFKPNVLLPQWGA
ncbi:MULTISPECIES: hypothetical protein [Vibrio]|uniref:hypothetical protein n=1 Tax=Vibrio TaxID=662 RepID=UPI001CDC956E|nr:MULTISPECIES: hypothetical protein [Vibrio]MCA2455800.1 hypothetical protein [Vibrio alginolyticus]MCA2461127.1 hypothetical protein [Vibrio alginolyticus]MDW2267506.1 hypothetical protein [Vibrio sp. 1394]MDW2294701.1 hypothetical protein [Vibrio sp. 1404]